MTAHRFVDVALSLPVDQFFTYSVPESLHDQIALGMRVLVPMQKRVETGYVVGIPETSSVEKPRAVIDFPDAKPIIAADVLELGRWMAEYYCCSLGEALQCATPPGLQARTKRRYTLVHDRLDSGRYTDQQRKIIAALHRSGPMTDGELAKEAGATALRKTMASLERRGIVLAETLVTRAGGSMRTESWICLVEEAVPSGSELATWQRRAPKQTSVYLDLLHGDAAQPATRLYNRHGATAGVLRSLEEKGYVKREEREFYRSPSLPGVGDPSGRFHLNDEQQAAFDSVAGSIDAREFRVFLLKGITGSGKTEVYLQIIERALAKGLDAIVLVPEISLTPQTVGRFLSRFDRKVAVLHSGLSAGERYDEWRRARRGEVNIVVGARSAIFAPLPNLGVIVIDEEHDSSYKQNESPRYHARDVAIMRASLGGAVCVLGSATPSIESYHNSEKGKSVRLELNRRATSGKLPNVRVLDMREEVRETGGQVTLARALESAVQQRIDRHEQVILLLNRRGHSPFVLCPKCGWVAQCNDCQVSLTYHARGALLSCHYCNARQSVPQVCDECHFNPLIFMGTGTQKIEEYLGRGFPGARIERMDADTTAGKGGHAKILGRFAAGEIDILVGTQMIAKGHDFPQVTLVGVINADTGLSMPDFRASEQTFQLLTQVGGRAGRGERPGEVIVQTYRPHHYAIQAAASHDYEAFYAREIAERSRAAYPPFRRMLNFAIEAEDPGDAERHTARLHRILREQREALGFDAIEFLGPAPATVRRVKKKYRWNISALSRSSKRLNSLARAVRDQFNLERPKGVLLKVDPDPYGMF